MVRLTKNEQSAFDLKYVKGLTLKDTAAEMGITIGRVNQLLHKAKLKQREFTLEELIQIIDDKLKFGRPRIREYELFAIKKWLLKLYNKEKD